MSERQHRVVVYRTSSCPFCIAAEQLLTEKGIRIEQIYLDDHPDRRGFTASILPGHRTVPLVLIDDEAVGGLDALRALDAAGNLDHLVE